MGDETEDCVVFEQSDLFPAAFPVMDEIRKRGKLCDVILRIGDTTISCHRIVLAANIPYFYLMFLNDMVESTRKEITMKGIDPVALERLINFAYTGSIKINSSNVESLMEGSSYLQLTQVRDACAKYLKHRFHPHIVIGIRQFADSLGCVSLIQACDKYINACFAKVSSSEEFLNLNADELGEILSRDELQVSSEELVFEAVMKWVKHQPELRKDLLPKLLSKVRLPLLSPHYLIDRVSTEQIIKLSHQCRDLLDEARDFHLVPERQFLIDESKTKPRYPECFTGVMYAVGGLTKTGESLSTVEAYCPAREQWSPAEPMSTLRSRVGVASLHGRLYALGGYNGCERLATVESYDPEFKKWTKITPMKYKRSALGACSLGNSIYVCGGYNGSISLNSVERYSPVTDSWDLESPMIRFRSAGGVATLGGCIWAVGGHDGLSIFDSVERYDVRTPHWAKQKPMLTKRCRLGIATLNEKLYVCGGYDGNTFLQSIEEYDPVNCQWRTLSPMNHMRSRVALVANMGKLWAIGGYNGETNLSTVEYYDPVLDSWQFAAPMCAHEGGVGVGLLPSL